MSLLADALLIEGLDAEATKRVEAYLTDRGFYVTENWLRKENREKEERKIERQAAQVAALAKAIPYSGTIKDCQAQVYENTRGGGFHRCHKPARFVVHRKERDGKHEGHPNKNDGRLAVCRIHASDPTSARYHKHWSYERCAAEPVEDEYQPEGEQA